MELASSNLSAVCQENKREVEEEGLAKNGHEWRAKQSDLTFDIFMSVEAGKQYQKTVCDLNK